MRPARDENKRDKIKTRQGEWNVEEVGGYFRIYST